MQSESGELKSKANVARERSATLLKIIALLTFAAAGLVYFTASGLSQSDRDQTRNMGFDRQISENAQQMMRE